MKERRLDIDVAKALCICLVVIGHFNPNVCPAWWTALFGFIYSFHMPAFMFLSGLLYSLSLRDEPYLSFEWRKFKRLMIPYFSASAVIIVIKLMMQHFMPVKNAVGPFALLEMFWKPSAAVHLWFVWVLMLIFLIVPAAKSRYWPYALLCLSAVLWVVRPGLPDVFSLNQLSGMMVFFVCGWLSEKLAGVCIPHLPGRTVRLLCFALFVGFEALLVICPSSDRWLRYILPFLGIGAVMSLSDLAVRVAPRRLLKLLLSLGECSFVIYLFHSTFSECAKAVLSKFGFSAQNCFVPCLLISVLAGIALPVLAQRLVIERSGLLSFLFGIPCKSFSQDKK